MKTFALVLLVCLFTFSVVAQDDPITAANANDLTEIARLGRGEPGKAIYSPNSKLIAVPSSVGVWLYEASQLASEADPPLLPSQQNITIDAPEAAFSSDGSLLIMADRDQITLWDTNTYQPSFHYDASAETYKAVVFTPDEEGAIAGNRSGELFLFDFADSSEPPMVFDGHSDAIIDLALNPDKTLLATASEDGSGYLLNPETFDIITSLEGHSRDLTDVEFSPDGSLIATSSEDSSVILWDGADGTQIESFELDERMSGASSLSFSPDGSELAVGYGTGDLIIWDVNPESSTFDTPLRRFETDFSDIAAITFSPDGQRLLTVARISGTIVDTLVELDAQSGEILTTPPGHVGSIHTVEFTPDGSTLLFAAQNGQVFAWDTNTKPTLAQTPTIDEVVQGLISSTNDVLVLAPDGSYAVAVHRSDAYILEPTTLAVQQAIDLSVVGTAAIGPDSRLIALGASSGLYLYDAQTGLFVTDVTNIGGAVSDINFNPDGSMIAVASRDGTMRVYGVRR